MTIEQRIGASTRTFKEELKGGQFFIDKELTIEGLHVVVTAVSGNVNFWYVVHSAPIMSFIRTESDFIQPYSKPTQKAIETCVLGVLKKGDEPIFTAELISGEPGRMVIRISSGAPTRE